MKIVSNELKIALKQPTTQRKGRILVNGNYYEVYNVEYYADAYNEGNVIGNAIASQLDFDLPYMDKFETFKYYDGVWTGAKYEYVDMGTFTVFDEQDEDEFNKHITAFDNLIKFNKQFEDVGGYPKTLYQELKNICSQAEVELQNASIPNGNFVVENNQFVEGENLKTVLKAIEQISGTYGIIKNDKLVLQLKNQTSEKINKNEHEPIIWKRRTYGINQVVLGMEDVQGEYVLRQDDEDIAINGIHKLVINDNPFVYTQQKREQVIDELFNQVKGFGYVPYDLKMEWLNYMDIGDTISIDGIETLILRMYGKTPKSLESEMSAPAIIDSAVEYSNNTFSLTKRVSRTEFGVDKNAKEIQGIIETTEDIQKEINPTKNESGSEITTEDASDNPLTYLEIEGKSTQETRSGKNKLNITLSTQTKNGITFTNNGDGTFNVNGTATADTNFTLNSDLLDIIKLNTSYYIYTSVPYNIDTFNMSAAMTKKSDNVWVWMIGGKVSISPNEELKMARFDLFFKSGTTVNQNNVKLMLVESSVVDNEWEQYGVSPSPEFPSEIESVGYTNLYDKDTMPLTNGLWHNSNTLTIAKNGLGNYVVVPITGGKTYTVTKKNTIGGIYLATTSEQPINGSSMIDKNLPTKGEGLTSLSIKTSKEANYLFISLYGGSPTDEQKLEIIEELQVEEGTITHSYIPYGKYAVDIKTIGKNKLNKNIVAKGYRLGSDGNPFAESGYWLSEYIKVKSSSSYVYSRKGVGGSQAYAFYDKDKNFISRSFMANSTKIDISTTDTTKYIRITDLNDSLDVAQLEEGSNATEYQPYQERISVIVLDAPLRSLPNGVKDKAYIRNNKLYVDRKVGSVVLDGSESWVKQESWSTLGNNTNAFYHLKPTNMLGAVDDTILSSHFKFVSNVQLYDKCGIYASQNLIIRVPKTISTVTELKTWLSTHNTQVDYELATPVTEEIGEIKMLSTFKGINHISTTDKLEPIINLTYVRDTVIADYVENHVAELKITENEIKESVESVSSSVDGLNTTINRVEEITNDNSQVINVISTNIDKTSGEVREVTTTTGFTFNADGMTIDDGSGFKAQHRSGGTYYKDGESIVGQYTKDGSKQKDLELFGTYSYGKESIDDTPMFVGQLYTDSNGERGFGHFYNGEG